MNDIQKLARIIGKEFLDDDHYDKDDTDLDIEALREYHGWTQEPRPAFESGEIVTRGPLCPKLIRVPHDNQPAIFITYIDPIVNLTDNDHGNTLWGIEYDCRIAWVDRLPSSMSPERRKYYREEAFCSRWLRYL